MIWKKTGKTVHANGETEITYSPKNAGSALVLFGGLHVYICNRAEQNNKNNLRKRIDNNMRRC